VAPQIPAPSLEHITNASGSQYPSSIDRLATNDPTGYFHLENGVDLKSVKDLLEYLPKMDDALFTLHVGADYNHFAEWVRWVFNDEQLADRIASAKTKDAIRAAVIG
jgi:hypothetical protein